MIEDGSPDNCGSICESWAKKDARIRVFHVDNGGSARARNFGLLHAKGKYVGFVDADDLIFEDYLQKLYDAVIWCNPDVIYFYAKYGIDTRKRAEFPNKLLKLEKKDLQILSAAALYHIPDMDKDSSKFYNINSFSSWGQVYKRNIYEEHHIFFTEGITLSEDGLANLELLHYTNIGAVVCQQLYNYRMDNISATRSYKADLIEMFDQRDQKVKEIIERLYKNSNLYIKRYYSSLIYQMRIIFENCIFSPLNLASKKEKEQLFFKVIDKPDYAKAIKLSDPDYLLKEDKIFLELAKQRQPGKVMIYIKKENRKKFFRQKIKKWMSALRLKRT